MRVSTTSSVRRTRRSIVAAAAALALVAASCSSDGSSENDDGDDGGTTEPVDTDGSTETEPAGEDPTGTDAADSEPTDTADGSPDTEPADDEPIGELTASAPGVTADTITLGFSYIDFDELVDLGLSPSGWGDQELAMQTMVDAVNADGGVNGRQIEMIYEPYSVLGTEGAEAACLSLTEDNEVFGVLGGFVGPAEPANTCIAGRQETLLVGGVQSEERLSEATAPWLTPRPLRTRQAEILASLVNDQGDLEGRSIAIVASADSIDVLDSVGAAFADAGNEPTEKLISEAEIGDIVAEDAVWGTIVERLRSSDVDTVVLVGNPSQGVRNIAQQGLDVDVWALDQEALLSLGTAVDLEDARDVIAAVPLTNQALWDDSTMQECRDAYTSANPDVEIIEPADLVEGDEDIPQGIFNACGNLRLFMAAAEPAGADLTNESFATAAATLDQFSIPGQPFASLGDDKSDSNDSFQLGSFNPDIGQDGGYDPVTDIVDVTP